MKIHEIHINIWHEDRALNLEHNPMILSNSANCIPEMIIIA